jgi:hypothetical protein
MRFSFESRCRIVQLIVGGRESAGADPALIAWAARSGPPTVMSRRAAAFSCRTASGSKSRSIRVLALDT